MLFEFKEALPKLVTKGGAMIEPTLKKMSAQLEAMIRIDIPLKRALDLLEASTDKIEELLAINTMRESMQELERIKAENRKQVPVKITADLSETAFYVA